MQKDTRLELNNYCSKDLKKSKINLTSHLSNPTQISLKSDIKFYNLFCRWCSTETRPTTPWPPATRARLTMQWPPFWNRAKRNDGGHFKQCKYDMWNQLLLGIQRLGQDSLWCPPFWKWKDDIWGQQIQRLGLTCTLAAILKMVNSQTSCSDSSYRLDRIRCIRGGLTTIRLYSCCHQKAVLLICPDCCIILQTCVHI